MEIDIRSANQDKIDAIDAILQQAVQEALDEENAWRSEGAELTVDVEQVGKRPAAKGSADARLVQSAAAAVRWVGLEPQLRVSSTDANIPISLGIPAITLSRGGVSEDAHAPAEYWQNKDSHLALQVGLLTLLAEAGLAAD